MDTKIKSYKLSSSTSNPHQTTSGTNTLKRTNFKSISRRGTGYFSSKSWKKDTHKSQKSLILKHIKTKPKTSKTEVPTSSSMCRPGTLYSDVLFGRKTPSSTASTSPINSLRAARSLTSLVTPITVETKLHAHVLESAGKIVSNTKKTIKKYLKSKSAVLNSSPNASIITLMRNQNSDNISDNINFEFDDATNQISVLSDIVTVEQQQEQEQQQQQKQQTILNDVNENANEYNNIDQMLEILKTKVGCQLSEDVFQYLDDDLNIFKQINNSSQLNSFETTETSSSFGGEKSNLNPSSYFDINSSFPYNFDDQNYRLLEEKAFKSLEAALQRND